MKTRLKKLYIKKFIEGLMPTDIKVRFDNESYFQYNDEENLIISIKLNNDNSDILIDDFVKERFNIKINYLLLSILHEIGHYYTFTFEDKVIKDMTMLKAIDDFENQKISIKDVHSIYFNTPLEYKATKWAIDYYKTNEEKCKDFLRKLNLTIDTLV